MLMSPIMDVSNRGGWPSHPMDPESVVSRFIDVAERYCSLLDSDPLPEREVLVRQAAALLPELYLGALELMQVPVPEHDLDEDQLVSHEDWHALFKRLGGVLGDFNYYWEVFDPYVDEDKLTSSLADDLSDVYRDVKEGLLKFRGVGVEADLGKAMDEWRESFRIHWGGHLVDAMRAIHRILYPMTTG